MSFFEETFMKKATENMQIETQLKLQIIKISILPFKIYNDVVNIGNRPSHFKRTLCNNLE